MLQALLQCQLESFLQLDSEGISYSWFFLFADVKALLGLLYQPCVSQLESHIGHDKMMVTVDICPSFYSDVQERELP